MKKIIFSMLFLAAMQLNAQPPRPTPTPNDTLQSVRVFPNHQVMFSIYAPKATSVTIGGDFKGGYPSMNLIKAETGVWTVTTASLTPDVYSYDFSVDGIRTFDPKNPQYKESEYGLSNIFLMDGKESEYCSTKNLPHGQVNKVWLHSSVLNSEIRMHVYLPPGFEKIKKKLPVLYLQHGGGDNDGAWSTVGKANFILDNLLAEGKINPMVVVMPMGHPTPGFHMEVGIDADPYYDVLFKDIIPYVEDIFNVSNKRYDRAFAGLSMGGLQALNIALFKPEIFGYVLPLSTGYFPPQLAILEEKYTDALKNPEINKLKLFWIAMGGEQDIAFKNGQNVLAMFNKYGIKYQTNDYPAAHTFITWRHNLLEFAPLLFK